MTGSLSISLHLWRGIGPDVEPDLFLFRWRIGFVTVSVCKVCVLERYRKLKAAIGQAIATSEGR